MAPSTVYKDVKGSKEKSREERGERLLLWLVKEKEEIGVTKWEKYDSYSWKRKNTWRLNSKI